MKSLSEKIKSKVSRRASEAEALDLTALSKTLRQNSLSNIVMKKLESEDPPSPSRLRASSLSLHPADLRSRSRSASRRSTKELIRQETHQVIQKKLLHILEDVGLQLPIPLKPNVTGFSGSQSKILNVYVANTHDCIYLSPALSTSFNYEDADNDGNEVLEAEAAPVADDVDGASSSNSADSDPSVPDDASYTQDALHAKMKSFDTPNYLCSRLDTNLPIPHLFGIVVELKKEASVKAIHVDFLSVVKTLWLAAEGNFRHQYEEKFDIGALDWNLSLADADYFINSDNSNDTKTRGIEPDDLVKRTRKYYLNGLNRARYLSESSASNNTESGSDHIALDSANPPKSPSSLESSKAGIYVFLLPVLFPFHIPASVNAINGSLAHRLAVKVADVSEKSSMKKSSIRFNYVLPMVRTPPSMANSVADKPINVNRTWNESLHYSITFPRKYVSLGSEHTVNVQLVPLVKDVCIKRIKFNILERMTYVSRDLTKEYQYDGQDSVSSRRKTKKCKERVVRLCELKTKSKSGNQGSEPFKEEVISCPDNNLLFSCYEKSSVTPRDLGSKDVIIASPLDINIALPFLTSHSDKYMLTSSIIEDKERLNLIPSTFRKSSSMKECTSRKDSIASSENLTSPIIGSLETHISHIPGGKSANDDVDEDVLKISSSSLLMDGNTSASNSFMRGVTSKSRALSPDSNFRHIQITHRFQVCFRILKPDPKDNYKLHHYEVVVDTPVVLLSAKCSDDSIQLPKYDDLEGTSEQVNPPQFECQPPVHRPGINFRMPSFQENGISIKPLSEYDGDQLPSFEEATSGPSSPKARPASVVSLDPTAASSAPLYTGALSPESLLDKQSTIDDILVEKRSPPKPRSESMVRSSLRSSFAPSQVTPLDSVAFHAENSTSSFGVEALEVDLGSDVGAGSSATTRSKSSSCLLEEGSQEAADQKAESGARDSAVSPLRIDITGGLNVDANGHETEGAELDISTDPEMEVSEDSDVRRPGLKHNMTSINIDGVQGQAQNIFGQDVSFEQKLQLLQNQSLNEVDLVPPEPMRGSNDQLHLAQSLTDTLNESSQPQTLYHAYQTN